MDNLRQQNIKKKKSDIIDKNPSKIRVCNPFQTFFF